MSVNEKGGDYLPAIDWGRDGRTAVAMLARMGEGNFVVRRLLLDMARLTSQMTERTLRRIYGYREVRHLQQWRGKRMVYRAWVYEGVAKPRLDWRIRWT
jgi:hypothetical protein